MPKKTKGPTPAQHKKDVIEAIRALRKLTPVLASTSVTIDDQAVDLVERLEDYLEGLGS